MKRYQIKIKLSKGGLKFSMDHNFPDDQIVVKILQSAINRLNKKKQPQLIQMFPKKKKLTIKQKFNKMFEKLISQWASRGLRKKNKKSKNL